MENQLRKKEPFKNIENTFEERQEDTLKMSEDRGEIGIQNANYKAQNGMTQEDASFVEKNPASIDDKYDAPDQNASGYMDSVRGNANPRFFSQMVDKAYNKDPELEYAMALQEADEFHRTEMRQKPIALVDDMPVQMEVNEGYISNIARNGTSGFLYGVAELAGNVQYLIGKMTGDDRTIEQHTNDNIDMLGQVAALATKKSKKEIESFTKPREGEEDNIAREVGRMTPAMSLVVLSGLPAKGGSAAMAALESSPTIGRAVSAIVSGGIFGAMQGFIEGESRDDIRKKLRSEGVSDAEIAHIVDNTSEAELKINKAVKDGIIMGSFEGLLSGAGIAYKALTKSGVTEKVLSKVMPAGDMVDKQGFNMANRAAQALRETNMTVNGIGEIGANTVSKLDKPITEKTLTALQEDLKATLSNATVATPEQELAMGLEKYNAYIPSQSKNIDAIQAHNARFRNKNKAISNIVEPTEPILTKSEDAYHGFQDLQGKLYGNLTQALDTLTQSFEHIEANHAIKILDNIPLSTQKTLDFASKQGKGLKNVDFANSIRETHDAFRNTYEKYAKNNTPVGAIVELHKEYMRGAQAIMEGASGAYKSFGGVRGAILDGLSQISDKGIEQSIKKTLNSVDKHVIMNSGKFNAESKAYKNISDSAIKYKARVDTTLRTLGEEKQKKIAQAMLEIQRKYKLK